MVEYKDILVATHFRLTYEKQVGVFLLHGGVRFVGMAYLHAKKGKLYADLMLEEALLDYYPEINTWSENADLRILHSRPRLNRLKSIGEQLALLAH